jgi:small subunit ribosomal protein S3
MDGGWYTQGIHLARLRTRDPRARRQAPTNASVSGIEIERNFGQVTVTVHTAKPGIVIGKGGQNVEILRQQIGALTKRKVKLEIKEIRQPELDAYLVAMNIAQQLGRRIAFKKAMKQAIQRSMKAGAKGVKIAVAAGGGAEMSRREWTARSHPIGTLRADISYARFTPTTHGCIWRQGLDLARGDMVPCVPTAGPRPPLAGSPDHCCRSGHTAGRAAGCPGRPRAPFRRLW